MAVEGATNLYVAKGKATAAVALTAVAPETGPGAVAAGAGAAYLSISSVSGAMTGLAQITGAITGKTEEANKVADGLAASTTVFGLITSVITGDVKKGAAGCHMSRGFRDV